MPEGSSRPFANPSLHSQNLQQSSNS